ncbi:hypothetical protein WR25_08526 [Diploscapter pachys]|uniref:Uncharacterized protein n=1 Tax=Diploscapter pachys TaxID=2018661 RepID=A0A2A2JZC7_9BILA|nr:hypothetical protein WR25_08526 [Diploscapter pachys]
MLQRVQVAERIELRRPQHRRMRGGGAIARPSFGGCCGVNHASLNNEIGKVDVTNAAESLFLCQRIVNCLRQALLQLLLALAAEHLILGRVAQRQQHRRPHGDVVGLQILDDRVVVGGGDGEADLHDMDGILQRSPGPPDGTCLPPPLSWLPPDSPPPPWPPSPPSPSALGRFCSDLGTSLGPWSSSAAAWPPPIRPLLAAKTPAPTPPPTSTSNTTTMTMIFILPPPFFLGSASSGLSLIARVP